MPNWVTNELKASKAVIEAALNEDSRFDFNKIMPSPCPVGRDWNGVSLNAETAAEAVLGAQLSGNPLLRALQQDSRSRVDLKALSDDCFEQFIGMLRNHRACGFLHDMDFARASWGTKWIACDVLADLNAGIVRFDSAWSCPKPVFAALSARFPDEVLTVAYADEDIGSNCGIFKLKNGVVVESDEAGSWVEMPAAEKEKWCAFARQVKGWGAESDDASED